MNTSYKRDVVSPFQMRNRPYDIQNNSVVQEEIKKNIKTYSLTAEFTEDIQTLQAFKHINGVIAFLCTLKKDGQVIGFGRGMSVISSQNRFLEKAVTFSANAALIDSVVRASKIIDITQVDFGNQNTFSIPNKPYGTKEVEEFIPITDKQKNFLNKLLQSSDASDEEFSQIEFLSKDEAREKINLLVTAGDNKIDY